MDARVRLLRAAPHRGRAQLFHGARLGGAARVAKGAPYIAITQRKSRGFFCTARCFLALTVALRFVLPAQDVAELAASKQRIFSLLGMSGVEGGAGAAPPPDPLAAALGPFGLGSARSLAAYEAFVGVDLKRRASADATRSRCGDVAYVPLTGGPGPVPASAAEAEAGGDAAARPELTGGGGCGGEPLPAVRGVSGVGGASGWCGNLGHMSLGMCERALAAVAGQCGALTHKNGACILHDTSPSGDFGVEPHAAAVLIRAAPPCAAAGRGHGVGEPERPSGEGQWTAALRRELTTSVEEQGTARASAMSPPAPTSTLAHRGGGGGRSRGAEEPPWRPGLAPILATIAVALAVPRLMRFWLPPPSPNSPPAAACPGPPSRTAHDPCAPPRQPGWDWDPGYAPESTLDDRSTWGDL